MRRLLALLVPVLALAAAPLSAQTITYQVTEQELTVDAVTGAVIDVMVSRFNAADGFAAEEADEGAGAGFATDRREAAAAGFAAAEGCAGDAGLAADKG